MLKAADSISDVIINPDNGPGTEAEQGPGTNTHTDYQNIVTQCKKKGIGVLGYVATGYAKKDPEFVYSEINTYFSWYAVDGIFLDEVPGEEKHLTYYLDLYEAIQGKVVLNHGTLPHQGYLLVGDVLTVFESSAQQHAQRKFPAWVKKNRSKIYQIVIDCRSSNRKQVLKKVAECADYVYITNDVEPNPYDVLPDYWDVFVKECAKC